MLRNHARLTYKNESFSIWQDSNSNWCFTYQNLDGVNTGSKELQPALNLIHESIEDKLRPMPKKKGKKRQSNGFNRPQKKTSSLLDKLDGLY